MYVGSFMLYFVQELSMRKSLMSNIEHLIEVAQKEAKASEVAASSSIAAAAPSVAAAASADDPSSLALLYSTARIGSDAQAGLTKWGIRSIHDFTHKVFTFAVAERYGISEMQFSLLKESVPSGFPAMRTLAEASAFI